MDQMKKIYHVKQDEEYQHPYIDADEWRERILPDGERLQYRYMHGGFTGTNVKFIFCFPQQENYSGHFFQYLSPFPGPDEEIASINQTGEDDKIAFAVSNGAYYVESNMGSKQMFGSNGDNTIVYKSSAAVAEYSREKAMEIYGCSRPFGYVYGGSGGGYKTMACIENTDAWDGAVPFVIGSPVSLPNTITMHAQGQRALRHVFGKITDALDAGGSGDMYEGLSEDEAFILKEITAMGFSPLIWFVEAGGSINDGSLPVLTPGVKMADPQFFQDFWSVPGYLGADGEGGTAKDRLQFEGVVKDVHWKGMETEEKEIDDRNGVDSAWQKMLTDGNGAWIELEKVPEGEDLYLGGVNIHIESGAAAGKQLLLGGIHENYLLIGMCYGMDNLDQVLAMVKPGDRVSLDNSDYIAIQSYYRHQVPKDLSFHAWDQFRNEQGAPILPQRQNVMGYQMTGTGTVQDGNIQGKVIVVQSLMDEATCPWCADWYRNKIRQVKGNDEDFRLYYMERCMHGNEIMPENSMVTNYMGALRQALLDISDWVEHGTEPLQTTAYRYEDGQILVAEDISERKGIQPKVTLSANGSNCAHVRIGEHVTFTAKVELPEGSGQVTAIDYGFVDRWDATTEDTYPVKGVFEVTLENNIAGALSHITHAFDQPGTYFVSVRVKANRHGDADDIFTQIRNIARVRVIVE